MISKFFAQLMRHKIKTGVVILLTASIGYFGYTKIFSNDDNAVRYVFAQVQKDTLTVSISGNGKVSALNQIDIKPKTSGEITAVYVKLGQKVDAGTVLVEIDSREAERAVRDAETALETAKLELNKTLEPVDTLTLLQAENSLNQANELKKKAEDNIQKTYEESFNTIVNAFLDLPGIMGGLENILFGKTIDPNQENIAWYINQTNYQNDERNKATRYRDDAYNAYNKGRTAYTKNFESYKSTSRTSDKKTIETLITETYNTTRLIAEAIKTIDNYIDFVQNALELRHIDIPEAVSTQQLNIANYTGKTNNHLLSLLSAKYNIQDSNEALVNANRTIEERKLSLEKAKNEQNKLNDIRLNDIRTKKIAIQQKEDALITAKRTLANTQVRAPFAGIIAKVNAQKGGITSTETTIATLVTEQKIAEVSLNEFDITQVKVGQKTILTLDAIPDLTITGQVAEIVNPLSNQDQQEGTNTYTVKINFDTQDDRVKIKMSVSATIIIEVKPDILLVPNSAIKSQEDGTKYVEMPDDSNRNVTLTADTNGITLKNPLRRQTVEIGITNDKFTEIVSGLSVEDVVMTQTIQPKSTPFFENSSSGLPSDGYFGM